MVRLLGEVGGLLPGASQVIRTRPSLTPPEELLALTSYRPPTKLDPPAPPPERATPSLPAWPPPPPKNPPPPPPPPSVSADLGPAPAPARPSRSLTPFLPLKEPPAEELPPLPPWVWVPPVALPTVPLPGLGLPCWPVAGPPAPPAPPSPESPPAPPATTRIGPSAAATRMKEAPPPDQPPDLPGPPSPPSPEPPALSPPRLTPPLLPEGAAPVRPTLIHRFFLSSTRRLPATRPPSESLEPAPVTSTSRTSTPSGMLNRCQSSDQWYSSVGITPPARSGTGQRRGRCRRRPRPAPGCSPGLRSARATRTGCRRCGTPASPPGA